MKVKPALWSLSVLLFWMAWLAGAPSALANGPTGSSGCVDDTWATISTEDAPSARSGHMAVWTGKEMIIWGGLDGRGIPLNTGDRYDPATDTWAAMSTDGAPSVRAYHTAIWTGSQMLVWGGAGPAATYLNTGGLYDPATDTWAPTSLVSAPTGRRNHTAVWTGTEMIIWGGFDGRSELNTGSRYDPATDTWVPISTEGAPNAREFHTAVWTGKEMLVWGGFGPPVPPGVYFNTGGCYDPVMDTWMATSTDGAPSGRSMHTAVWTGTEMLVWGGGNQSSGLVNTGGLYDPATDTWVATSTISAPSGRYSYTAVWTGLEMLVWGGCDNLICSGLNTGGRYDPASDTWAATSLVNAPSARGVHTAVWTSLEMLVWGGGNASGSLNTGGRYCASAGGDGQ